MFFSLCGPLFLPLFCPEEKNIFFPTVVLLSLKGLSPEAAHSADGDSTEALLAEGLFQILCWRPALVGSEVL